MQFLRYNFLHLLTIILLFLSNLLIAQVVFKQLPGYELKIQDKAFFEITETRNIILLNGKWSVYPAEEQEDKVTVNIPSVFEGEGEFIFETTFQLTDDELNSNSFELVFLGLNYRADISVNGIIIHRHTGGEFPFSIEMARDILKSDADNIISVNLFYKLDSENTIPLKQRFLFAKNYGGIVHDVYVYKKPAINISNFEITKNIASTTNKASVEVKSVIINQEALREFSSPDATSEMVLKTSVISPDSQIISAPEHKFSLKRNKEESVSQSISIGNPFLWSPTDPDLYIVRCELWREDELIDVIDRTVALYSFEVTNNLIMLNGKEFKLNGVTYTPEFHSFGDLMDYNQFEKDIRLIKETGFNAVRIAKTVPHPYCLELCEKYGLLTFIEIPIGMLPKKISQDQNFVARCKYFLTSYFRAYKKYSVVAGIGLGTSFLSSLDSHRSLLINLGGMVKENTNWVTYASFVNLNIRAIDNVDMYGLEMINQLPEEKLTDINQLQNELGVGRIFVSEATYTVNRGSSDGYVNKFSYEAQAKYFADLIDFSQNNSFSGYFINSIIDIRGDYSSLLSGYNSINLYNIGLVGEDRETNRIGYKVVSSKLNNTERVTIPIGSMKDDAPMIFIVFGLLLALLMGVLVNSGKKFREDASRALLRPYNYYADVRDQRIMSAYHTTFLGVIILIVQALILSNILFYLKTNIIFEKLLLSFGSSQLLKVVNYLCWNPFNAIVWISIFGILFILLLTLVIKIASFFIRTRVYLSSIYFAVVWSFLPIVFLIPLGIVLYRVLVADVVNLYIYLSLVVITLWVIHRLLKGIYVIFDVSPGNVYFYSTLFIMLLGGGILFYYEINNSAIQYIIFTLRQYRIFG